MKGPALVVGASGGVGGALYNLLSKERRVVAVSSQARARSDWYETDYSEDSLNEIAGHLDSRFPLIFFCAGFGAEELPTPLRSGSASPLRRA